MTPFFSPGPVKIDPQCLWFCDGPDGLRPIEESLHARAARGETVSFEAAHRMDGQDPGAVIHGLMASMANGGWTSGSRITIAVERHGRCVLMDGLHRSSAALMLSGILCEAHIAYREAEWIALRYAIKRLNGGENRLYQPIAHPDLAHLPVWRTDTEERANTIACWMRSRSGAGLLSDASGLDVGCHTGALTCALARHGYLMVGTDTDRDALRIAERLAWSQTSVSFIEEWTEASRFHRRCDFVVFLSVLNHYLTDGRGDEAVQLFLRCLAVAPVVFLDCPLPGEPVGGSSDLVDPEVLLRWCAAVDAGGSGEVVSPGGPSPRRPMLVWMRGTGLAPPTAS